MTNAQKALQALILKGQCVVIQTLQIPQWGKIIFPTMADSSAPCAPIVSNLGTSFGAQLGGVFFAFMFYGANCLQM
jgi:hypothetical protein